MGIRIVCFCFFSVFLVLVCACGGPALSTDLVHRNSREAEVDLEALPVRVANNVRLFQEIPDRKYSIIATRDSWYQYQRLSITYKKIECKKHMTELRNWAGKLGATAIIVMVSDQTHDVGGVGLAYEDGMTHTVLLTDDETREYVRTFAIYCK